jgi:predicted enzyme related to lactoylglutathione lyase
VTQAPLLRTQGAPVRRFAWRATIPPWKGGAALCLLVLITAAGTSACTQPLRVPPVAPEPTHVWRTGAFVWNDLLTPDVESAKAFYGGLFGWDFRDTGSGTRQYTVIRHEGHTIGGILRAQGVAAPRSALWLSYMSIGDPPAAARLVGEAGGKVFETPELLQARGEVATVADPQGAVLALIRATSGDPVAGTPAVNEWLWHELWTDESEKAADFYERLAGYRIERGQNEQREGYLVLMCENRPCAGIIQNPYHGVRSRWLPYVRVQDPAALAARVPQLGGRVILAPEQAVRGGSVSVIEDPNGAALVLQRWMPTL